MVLTDIRDEQGQRAANEICESGGEAIYLHLDVTSEAEWVRVVEAAVARFGRLDILVNNAGSGARYRVEDTSEEDWDGQMNGACQGGLPGYQARHSPVAKGGAEGSIINVSSIYGLVGSETSTAYHAAKGAIRLFTKSAAIQYANENIRVNSVHPGYAHTPLTDRGYQDPAYFENIRSRIPMGRVGNAYDIAYGMLYLASDESSFVTGSELVIDGGTTAQ